jgi:hypothetical protein
VNGSRPDGVDRVRSEALSRGRRCMDGHQFGRASAVRVVAYQVPLDTRVARVKAITLGRKRSARAAYITETVESSMRES